MAARPPAWAPAFAGLLPHPPILVPAVGGARLADCSRSHAACRDFASRLVAARPARLLLVSPHAPRRAGAFGVTTGARLTGDLASFGAPDTVVSLPGDETLVAALRTRLRATGLAAFELPSRALDHGAVVPLWFLAEAGWAGPSCVVSLPYPGSADPVDFGRVAGAAAAGLGGRCALVASGDLSHRTRPGAPAGFDPRARDYDHALRERIATGRLAEIPKIDPDLRALAAEDATESTTLVAAAFDFRSHGHEVLSYEDPFGVGYLVAVLHDGGRDGAGLDVLLAVAREAVRARLAGRPPAGLPAPTGELAATGAVFVTWRRRDGALRGCIGALTPLHRDLVAEVADRACAAALEDPRFPPVTLDELAELDCEISLLGALHTVARPAELDPARFGVVVSDGAGRRGVLLPGLAGVDRVERQLEIARRKAGIPPGSALRLQRFAVRRLREVAPERP